MPEAGCRTSTRKRVRNGSEQARMPASNNVGDRLTFARLPSRILAAFLDLVTCYVLVCHALMLTVVWDLDARTWVLQAVLIAVPWLYFAGFEASTQMATPGKKYYRIIVTDASGRASALRLPACASSARWPCWVRSGWVC